jgi:hypothetical protein
MNTEWITDRLPTAEDATADGMVWTMYLGDVVPLAAERIPLGTPWQPIHKPAPYVKPKRWTVEFYRSESCYFAFELVGNNKVPCHLFPQTIGPDEAQQIEDIYNKVMP